MITPVSTHRTSFLRHLRRGKPSPSLKTPNFLQCQLQGTVVAKSTAPSSADLTAIHTVYWTRATWIFPTSRPGSGFNTSILKLAQQRGHLHDVAPEWCSTWDDGGGPSSNAWRVRKGTGQVPLQTVPCEKQQRAISPLGRTSGLAQRRNKCTQKPQGCSKQKGENCRVRTLWGEHQLTEGPTTALSKGGRKD